MRARIGWLALLLTAGMALLPTTAMAQPLSYEVPRADPVFPVPLYSPKPELGGFFFNGEFLYWRQTNPMGRQPVAVRGFLQTTPLVPGVPAPFFGSGAEALNTESVAGPGTYVPGYRMGLGYRFRNGLVAEVVYSHMFNARYTSGATLFPSFDQLNNPANTFLFSPVFNFTNDWAGVPDGPFDLVNAYGIWNGADEMSIKFEQRLDKWDFKFRIPIYETEYDPVQNPDKIGMRCYGIAGLRHYWLWERFKWRTVDRDAVGQAEPAWVAEYSNVVSQPMYGPVLGWGGEIYYGHGFALSLDLYAGAYVNFVREFIRWERGDQATGAKRARRVYTVVGETEAHVNLWWYPIEGVQVRIGYDVMALYNTIYSPNPIDFDFNGLAPEFKHKPTRLIDGINVGIGLIF